MADVHDNSIKDVAVKAVEETLFKTDINGHNRFGREVHDAVFEDGPDGGPSRFQRELKKAFYSTFGKWFFTGGAVIIVGFAGMYYQLQSNTEQINEGGRYTESDAIEDRRIQEARDQRQDEDYQILRQEINAKLDQIISRLIP